MKLINKKYKGILITSIIEEGGYALTTKINKEKEICLEKVYNQNNYTVSLLNNNKLMKIEKYFSNKPFIIAFNKENDIDNVYKSVKINELNELINKFTGININELNDLITTLKEFSETQEFKKIIP